MTIDVAFDKIREALERRELIVSRDAIESMLKELLQYQAQNQKLQTALENMVDVFTPGRQADLDGDMQRAAYDEAVELLEEVA